MTDYTSPAPFSAPPEWFQPQAPTDQKTSGKHILSTATLLKTNEDLPVTLASFHPALSKSHFLINNPPMQVTSSDISHAFHCFAGPEALRQYWNQHFSKRCGVPFAMAFNTSLVTYTVEGIFLTCLPHYDPRLVIHIAPDYAPAPAICRVIRHLLDNPLPEVPHDASVTHTIDRGVSFTLFYQQPSQ